MATMPSIKVNLDIDEVTLEKLADLIVAKLNSSIQVDDKSQVQPQEDPEKAHRDDSVAANFPSSDDLKNETADDLSAWEVTDEDLLDRIENEDFDYGDGAGEEATLHDLTNAELEEIANSNPFVQDLLRSKMVKDELVELVTVGYALDYGEFDELRKDELIIATEALGIRDEITTKTRKDDILRLVEKAWTNELALG